MWIRRKEDSCKFPENMEKTEAGEKHLAVYQESMTEKEIRKREERESHGRKEGKMPKERKAAFGA